MKFLGLTYLAGPMRGFDLYNFPAFHAAAKELRDDGWIVVSPAEVDEELGFIPTDDFSPEDFYAAMRRDLGFIIDPAMDAIHLLPCWHKSVGATAERCAARAVGLDIYYPNIGQGGWHRGR